MLSKQRRMRFVYYLPAFFAILRVLVTLWFLVSNPMNLPLRFIQLFHIGVYIVSNFNYYKLYNDGVPVLSLIAPTLVHAILIFIFRKLVIIKPFLVLGALDIVFLVCKSVKANLYPFYVEGEFDEDDPFAEEELSEDTE